MPDAAVFGAPVSHVGAKRRRAPAPTASTLSVTTLDSFDDLADHVPAWEDLAQNAVEPNVFQEPWLLLPAIRRLGAASRFRFILIYDQLRRLCGFFPFETRPRYRGMPWPTLRLWTHRYSFLGTPLVRAGCIHSCVVALTQWIGSSENRASLVEFPRITSEGEFASALREVLDCIDRPMLFTDSHVRPLWHRPKGNASAFGLSISGDRRRALNRRMRRLAERGVVRFVAAPPNSSIREWIEQFLRCELRGWKGRLGTAMACRAADRAFFREVLISAFHRRRLIASALYCDDKPIALRCSLIAGIGAFAFKTTYDEDFAPCSPGVLLELETAQRLSAKPDIAWMDSCTAPDNTLLNQLWPARRSIETVVIAAGHPSGIWAIRLLKQARRFKRRFQGWREASKASSQTENIE